MLMIAGKIHPKTKKFKNKKKMLNNNKKYMVSSLFTYQN